MMLEININILSLKIKLKWSIQKGIFVLLILIAVHDCIIKFCLGDLI